MGEEKRVLQIGGIAGLLAGVLILGSAITVLALLQPPFATIEEFLMGFGSRAAAVALANGLLLAGAIVAIGLFIALYGALKETSPGYALAGLLLFIVGIALVGVSLGGLYVFPQLAELYVDPMTTDAERTAIAQATFAAGTLLFQAQFIGGLFGVLSLLVLGAVMLGNPDFGRGYGALSLLFGVVGLVLVSLSPVLPLGVTGSVVIVVFLFIFGWKVYSLSRAA